MHRLEVKRIQIADALRWCGGCAGQGRLRVGDVMTPAPTCIASSTSVLDMVRMFHAKEFRHLLVTDTRGRLLGLGERSRRVAMPWPRPVSGSGGVVRHRGGRYHERRSADGPARTPLLSAATEMLAPRN